MLATPIGLVIAGAFAAASAVEYRLDTALTIVAPLARAAVPHAGPMVLVGDVLARRAPAAGRPVTPDQVEAAPGFIAMLGVVLYGYAALAYFQVWPGGAPAWASRSRSRSRCWPRR